MLLGLGALIPRSPWARDPSDALLGIAVVLDTCEQAPRDQDPALLRSATGPAFADAATGIGQLGDLHPR